jgi:serine/threonine protein kinase
MEPESAKPANSGPEAAGRAPPDDANRKAVERETIAASSSSFQGLVGGSSIGDLKAGRGDPNETLGLGRTIGRYKILKVLGSGSMGSVFLAHDSKLDRQVALKAPRLEHDSSGELSQRLYREARAAATLNHPNICPIYDVNEHEGTCFIAMGYVSGQPLAAYAASKKRQPEREAAKVVRKIALALEEAHAHGILHRDLKPTNIMIDKRGEPIVMDFGIACWFDDRTQTRLTQQGALVGTPAYMSPEQIEGRTKIGPASDIYSLGVLLYQILTGRCPFEGTVLNVISQVLHQDPPNAREFRPDLSPELIAICDRAMRKNPADRFASMRDFAKALTAFLNDAPRIEKSAKQAPEVDASAVETIEFEPPKVSRPKHATPTPKLPARPRRENRPRQPKQKRPSWPPAAVAVGVVTAVLVVGVVIGTLIARRPGNAAVPRTGQVAVDTSDAADGTTMVEQSAPVRVASNGQPAAASPASPSVVPAPAKNTPASTSVTAPVANPLPTTAANAPPPSAPAVGSTPTSAIPPITSSALAPQTNPAPTLTVSKPAVLPSSVVSSPPSPAATRATTGTAGGANPQPSPAAAHAPEIRDARSGPAEESDAPPPKGMRSRGGGQPPDDGPPPGGPGGRRPFDGGPARGMTIEVYFKKLDINGDGKLDPSELPMHIILRADTNKDGELTLKELSAAFKRRGRRLFAPPTPSEMRHLPGGERPPFGGAGPPGGGGGPSRPGGQGGF